MNNKYSTIAPGTKWIKTLAVSTVLFVMGRAFQSASKLDEDIKSEIAEWENGFTVMMNVLPNGPHIVLEKLNGQLVFRGSTLKDAELIVNFKNIDSAFLVFTAQVGTAQAFAQHRISVKGDLAKAMAFTRCLNILEGYLFPAFINKMILKKLPPMPLKKQLYRLIILTIGIPLGK